MLDFNGDVNAQMDRLFDELGIPDSVHTYDKGKVENLSDDIYDDTAVETIYSQLKQLKNLQ